MCSSKIIMLSNGTVLYKKSGPSAHNAWKKERMSILLKLVINLFGHAFFAFKHKIVQIIGYYILFSTLN